MENARVGVCDYQAVPYALTKLPCDMQPLHFPECLPRLLIVATECRRFNLFQYN